MKLASLPILFVLILLPLYSHQKKSLNGKSLVVVPTELSVYVMLTRDSAGRVINERGVTVELIHWLSNFLDFKFTYLNATPKYYETSGGVRGGKEFLLNHEADVALMAVVLTPERYRDADFPFPSIMGTYNMIIPMPKATTNIGAPWKPFSFEVWILLISSAAVLAASLRLTSRLTAMKDKFKSYFCSYQRCFDYVIVVFFGQGGNCSPTLFNVRIVAAVWCLAAFVLTNSYNTTLISYVTSPNWKPLVESISDIPKTPGVGVVVNKNMGAEKIFLCVLGPQNLSIGSLKCGNSGFCTCYCKMAVGPKEADSGILHDLGNMLRRDPSLLCNRTEDCLNKVKSGPFVYIQTANVQKYLVYNDYHQTKKCSMTMGKNGFLLFYASFVLPKGSPYTDLFSYGIMSVQETGLPLFWESWFVQNPAQCLDKQELKMPRLSLMHLTGPFVLLLIGWTLSFLAFLFEQKGHFQQFRSN